MSTYGIIYKVTNLVNGKIYIGQTKKSLESRKKQHLALAKKEGEIKGYFQRALRYHGAENFQWDIIDQADSAEELDDKEEDWVIKYGSFGEYGYNLTPGGNQTGSRGQTVYVFTVDGDFLSEHPSQVDAAESYSINHTQVTSVINGKRATYKGKVFLRGDDFENMKAMFAEVHARQEQERIRRYRKFVVVGIDSHGDATFCPTIFDMEKKTGVSIKNILDSCEGQRTNKMSWRFCWAIDFQHKESEAYEQYNRKTAEEMLNLYYLFQP